MIKTTTQLFFASFKLTGLFILSFFYNLIFCCIDGDRTAW